MKKKRKHVNKNANNQPSQNDEKNKTIVCQRITHNIQLWFRQRDLL